MRLFYEEELRRKSYYEMYQIAKDEKLVEAYADTPDREELINILLKYRGAKPDYCINIYNENGLSYLQALFDDKLHTGIHHENRIKIPHKIILPEHISSANAFLVNANNYLCGIFQLEKDLYSKDSYYIVSDKQFFRVENLKNNKFSLLFFKEPELKFINKFYNI